MLSNEFIVNRLTPHKEKISVVIDTDTYNEIDDQFALVYALKSSEQMEVKAVYAAPFSNERASTPGEGMEKSYDEILRVLELTDRKDVPAYRGSTSYLADEKTPCESDAVRDLIDRAMSSEEPLYVASLGAITNIASAILIEPRIIEKIVVVWLGGNAIYWPMNREFNLRQDVAAVRVVFDSGVPLIQIPCMNVAMHLNTTVHEMKYYLEGKNRVSSYLYEIFKDYVEEKQVLTKEIWDISVIAYLVNPEWVATRLIHSPIINDSLRWSVDTDRHFIRTALVLGRDHIFRDLFKKLSDN